MKAFADRAEAGRRLAERLLSRRFVDPVVLALPRGGVPVAAEIALRLNAPLDLLMVRKIGAPGEPELAVGAVADGAAPQIVVDEELARLLGVDRHDIEVQASRELAEIARRRAAYLAGRAAVALAGRTVILVDDGIATGSTVRAALQVLRRAAAERIVLAVPVAPREALARLRADVDEIVCLAQPDPFRAVGVHYADFHQVPDDEVVALLDAANARAARPPDRPDRGPTGA
ncbi:MAG TPA: phosphoribosyltransferase family protein [Burkholderiaceae bacterium]|nr:phosphoribosyltransferase family protein [Burkholderiaceae bacterium]